MDDLQRKMQMSRGCCSMQTSKRVDELIGFHVLNVLVAIGGVISVALLLAGMALTPIWVVVDPVFDAINVQQIEKRCLLYFGCAVLTVLGMAVLSINWFIAILPYLVLVTGAVGGVLLFFSAEAIRTLVKIDVISVNCVTNDFDAYDPYECQDRFELFDELVDESEVLSCLLMTRHKWLIVIYFALFKLVIGVLSAAVLVAVVVLPTFVLFSGGDISAFGDQVTFGDNPVIYTVVVITLWLAGAIGVRVVAVLSVKVTLWVCDVGQPQTEAEADSVIPATPTPGVT
ncbi:hypothetical protein P3T76_013530 [Phytophthora citrophthora]|uniref:Uncharacterized protein n=1 Tax=Phytophthora citrophthora TaxID=4793 RepID=A0AAD9G398_9STRA|nr:hypothetical protein P3T76_013530 [Phytophthora citrophthora]